MKSRSLSVALGLAFTASLLSAPAATATARDAVSSSAASPTSSAKAAVSLDGVGAGERRVRAVTYPGDGRAVHLSNVDRKLPSTSAAFRRFVTTKLTRAWQQMGGAAECKQAPTLTVKKWRSDGFATIPHVGTRIEGCGGSGYHAIYVRTAKGWKAPTLLGGHEQAFCTDLLAYRVPSGYSLGDCYPDVGNDLVRYRPSAARPPATSAYAARTLVRTVMGSSLVAADRWAKPAVVTELFEAKNEGAVLSVRTCVKRSHPTFGSYLGRARRGCVIRAAYYEDPPPALPVYAYESMMPMKRGALGRWRGLSLVGIGGS